MIKTYEQLKTAMDRAITEDQISLSEMIWFRGISPETGKRSITFITKYLPYVVEEELLLGSQYAGLLTNKKELYIPK